MRVNILTFGRNFFNRFRRDEKGATAIEYGLLVALLAIALMLGISQVYTSLNKMFVTMDTKVAESNAKAESST